MPPAAIHYHWVWDLDAPPEKLWPLASDTNRFNRDTGLPTVTDNRDDGEELENARRKLKMTLNGFIPVAWEERPFEWVRPWRFGVVRRYGGGLVEEMRVQCELSPLEGGRTRLVYAVAAIPTGFLGRLAIPFQIGFLSRRAFGKAFRMYAEYVRETGDSTPMPLTRPGGSARLPGAAAELRDRGVRAEVAERLTRHLTVADDLSLVRIRPAFLGRLWGLPRTEMLEACLEATRLGILDLQWDLLCPSCGGSKSDTPTLQDLRTRQEVHCDTCRIDFSVDFDRAVELAFRPNPGYRVAADSLFCVAGPQITPQVVVQQLLQPGETRMLRPTLEPGGYRAHLLGSTGGAGFTVDPESDGRRLEVVVGLEGIRIEGEVVVRDSPEFLVSNDTPAERLVRIERLAWTDDVVTAAEVTRNARFRDLFSSEVLRYGEFISVGTQTIVFTDLADSTRLYSRIGDAQAYGRVMEHFEAAEAAVAAEEGTVVKTIGDAVMAVFADPVAALRAIERTREALREQAPHDPLVLKAGLHHGPCIAVTLNDRLDYFGSTVNVAARMGGLSSGTDTVLAASVFERPEVQRWMEEIGGQTSSHEAQLKGIEGLSRVVRVRAAAG